MVGEAASVRLRRARVDVDVPRSRASCQPWFASSAGAMPETIAELGQRLRTSAPRAVVTLARGSSDHAATFARYLIETRAGVLTSSASPSVGSIYDSTPDLAGDRCTGYFAVGPQPRLAGDRPKRSGSRRIAGRHGERRRFSPRGDGRRRHPALRRARTERRCNQVVHRQPRRDARPPRSLDREIRNRGGVVGLARASLPKHGSSTGTPPCRSSARQRRCSSSAAAMRSASSRRPRSSSRKPAPSSRSLQRGRGPPRTDGAVVRKDFPVLLFGQADESLSKASPQLAGEFASRGARVLSAGVPGAPGTVAAGRPSRSADCADRSRSQSFYRLANALAARLAASTPTARRISARLPRPCDGDGAHQRPRGAPRRDPKRSLRGHRGRRALPRVARGGPGDAEPSILPGSCCCRDSSTSR